MAIKLVGIGGMGLMLSPSAKHLKPGGPARFLRIHDRGTKDERRDGCRQAWKDHGADIVHDYDALVTETLGHAAAATGLHAGMSTRATKAAVSPRGTARNVIAAQARLQGTIRTRDPAVRQQVVAAVEKIIRQTAAAADCSASRILAAFSRVIPGSSMPTSPLVQRT